MEDAGEACQEGDEPMQFLPKPPTAKAPADTFTGDA